MTTKIDLALSATLSGVSDLSQIIDAERMVRLHPHWHVAGLKPRGDGVTAQLKDNATDEYFELHFNLTFPTSDEILLAFENGPIQRIHFFFEEGRLKVLFDPHGEDLSPEEEQNLTLWLQSIRQYLRLYLRTTPYTRFFRFLMNRIILPMNPSQRKICLMLYRFTLLEIVVILIIVIGYFTLGR